MYSFVLASFTPHYICETDRSPQSGLLSCMKHAYVTKGKVALVTLEVISFILSLNDGINLHRH